MKYRLNHIIFVFVSALLVFSSCESEYTKLVNQEMAKGEIHTNYLFNLEVGDTKKEFFDKCWQLNKEQKVSQGSGNKYAKFFDEPRVGEDSLARVTTLFYGIFDDNDIMHGVEMKMSFYSWSPWNDTYRSDALISFMKKRYMKELGGNEFIELKIDDKNTAYVKVDGNRRIRMYILSPQEIMVKIEDLRNEIK